MTTLTKEQIQKNVAANFKHVRKEFKISAREMGERLGIPNKTIAAIEEGRTIAAHHVYRLSKLINVSMDTIYTTRLES